MPQQFDPLAEQTRSFNLRAASVEGKTITGIGVPYDTETEIWPGFFESFARNSVDDAGAILCYAHDEGIGKIASAVDTPEGRQITATISDTTRGRDVITLVHDGVLSKLSIRFRGGDYELTEREDGTHLRWLTARAYEYSIVEIPAYEDAAITDVRHAHPTERKTPMPETLTRAELDAAITPLTQALEDRGREISQLSTQITRSAAEDRIPFAFRSIGDYAAALVGKAGPDAQALAQRAYEGATLAQAINRPGWLTELEKRMQLKQPVTNLFTHTYDLPATGSTVEYGARKSDSTVTVAVQANEGDALASGKPNSYEVKSAPVKTYGGTGKMSFQAVERADVSLLDDLLYDQALEYGLQIEAATRALFQSAVTANEATPVATLPAAADVDDWITALLALVDAYDATPYVMDGLAVSTDVFLALALMPEDRKALSFVGQPDDKQGTIQVVNAQGSLIGIRVDRISNWAGKHATGYAKEAIKVKESAGAPLRLQDSNIVDLTKDFSVYGYAVHYAPKAGLLKPFKFGA